MPDELSVFRKYILQVVLKVLIFIGFIALVVIAIEEIPNGIYCRVFIIYLPTFALFTLIALLKNTTHLLKAIAVCTTLMLVGISEFYYFGIASQGFLYFFSAVVFAALLYGTFLAHIIMGAEIIIIFLFILLYGHKLIPFVNQQQEVSYSVLHWFSPFLIFIMFTVATYMILILMFRHMQELIQNQKLAGRELEQERNHLSELNERLVRTAYIDQITGLPNNRRYTEDMSDLIERNSGSEIFIHQILIEFSGFSDFNIKHGIEAGNNLLFRIAERMRMINGYSVYRETGTRFILHSSDCEKIDGNKMVLKVEDLLRHPIEGPVGPYDLKYRGAGVYYPDEVSSPAEMISTLMLSLSTENTINHNRIISHNRKFIDSMHRAVLIRDGLPAAIDRNEIYCLIQPRLDIITGRITGGEILSRWRDSAMGNVPPDEFIPAAERDGSIYRITENSIRAAIALSQMRFGGGTVKERPVYSVNLSPVLMHTNRLDELIALLPGKNSSADLEFELTEGVLLGSSESVLDGIRKLQHQKIGISIDDFGTGYSNIEYLQNIDAGILKIDKRFVAGLPDDEKQNNIIRAIVQIGRALGMYIVAEGVENIEQYKKLQELGADEIQGYLFARPMDFNSFRELADSHEPERWAALR